MSRSDKIKAAVFCLLAAAFFAVPWCWKAARDYAPGIAVLTGIAFSVFIGNPLQRYTAKITSQLLGATIVGMGFGMNLIEVLKAGGSGFIYTLIGISAGIGLGVLIGKRLGLTRDSMYLISVGTSICGGSAIAAAAPVLKAKSHDIALASATIFALNAIALLVFPKVGHLLGFTEEQFGFWAALGIHDTSSVVGAGLAYGDTALEIGTTVKLARALWIVPVTLFLSLFIAERTPDEGRKVKIKIPWFIPCFLVAAAVVTWIPVPEVSAAGKFIKEVSKYLMITTLFLIGANLSRDKLKELGIRPIIHGVILWVILASGWCFAIWTGWVNCKPEPEPPAAEVTVQPSASPEIVPSAPAETP